MAKSQKDARLIEYKDMISQLNMTVKISLKDTIASNQEQMRIMTEQIEYLTKKLFGTSSEKTQNLDGQYSLFLDEATSALDTDTENALMEAIDKMHGNRTLIIIAHRLTTIKNCDRIYRVENHKTYEIKHNEIFEA